MHMIGHAYDILVIVLSVTLFILLVVSIVVAIFVAKLVKSLRRIAEKGVLIADKAEATVTNIQETANLAGMAKLASGFMALFSKSKKGE